MTRARFCKPQTARGEGGASRKTRSSREQDPEHQRPSSLARLAGNHATADVLGGGFPLRPALQREYEHLFGADLSDIRLHTGNEAEEAAAAESAKAFTFGRDVVFSQGRYTPGTMQGKRLLAHELAHVLQQTGGTPGGSSPDRAESEASRLGARMGSAAAVPVTAGAAVGVQRAPEDNEEKVKKPDAKQKGKSKANPVKTGSETGKNAKAPMKTREKAVKAMSRDQKRQVEILEEFGDAAGRAQDEQGPHMVEERGARERTRRSERTRHSDPLDKTREHHGFPKYLGGNYEQLLIKFPDDLHYLYHEELDKIVGAPRKLGSDYYKNMSPHDREDLFRRVLDHAEDFDNIYSGRYKDKRTRIAAAVRRGMKEAGFDVPRSSNAGKPASGAAEGKPSNKKDAASSASAPTSQTKGSAATEPATSTPKKGGAPSLQFKTPRAPKTPRVARPVEPAKARSAAKPPTQTAPKLPKVSKSPPISAKSGGLTVNAPTTAKVTKALGANTLSKAPKAPSVAPKVPKAMPALKAPKLPAKTRINFVNVPTRPIIGASLATLAMTLLTTWLSSKLDPTPVLIEHGIDERSKEIQEKLNARRSEIAALVAAHPDQPVCANVKVELHWSTDQKQQEPDQLNDIERYGGLGNVDVAVSNQNLNNYETGTDDNHFLFTLRTNVLTFSSQLEFEEGHGE